VANSIPLVQPTSFNCFLAWRRSEIAATCLSAHALRSLRRPSWVLLALRELRFDMTQAQVARRIRVAQSYFSALERGEKEPGEAVLLAISREFGKSVDWLLTGK
jgi:DNA-binding XRE family transcriptional regulator